MARRPVQYRGRTSYCDKHNRRYEWYRGCGACESERPLPAPPSAEEKAAKQAHSERIRGAIDAALGTKGGGHGEG